MRPTITSLVMMSTPLVREDCRDVCFSRIAVVADEKKPMTWNFPAADLSLVTRLVAFVVLTHDPSVPDTAPDWWEVSSPHYLAVTRLLAQVTAGHQAAAD